jgi:hypothetical protein
VTRNNFASMMVTSFYVSVGSIFRQETFLKWIQAKNGFNYDATFRNFFSAGGWKQLSDVEKKSINKTFISIEKHTKEGVVWEFESNPEKAVKENLPTFYYELHPGEMEDVRQKAIKFENLYGNLTSMDYQTLISNLNKFTRPNKKKGS